MFRSFSDVESGRVRTAPHHRSALEANCNEIFQRTPAVTKEMLQKLQNTGPRRAVICGYELHTKQVSVLIALFLLFILSGGLAGLLWGTTMYKDMLRSNNLIISNKSDGFEDWVHPAPSYIQVYIFNYTNVDDVEAGYAEKLHVQELGPYTYKESAEKFDIEFNEDGTVVKYHERFHHVFVPEMSPKRRQNDRIVVPNIPLLAAAATSKNSYFLTRLAMSSLFRTLNAKAFLTLPAHQFIFGYDDDFYNLAKGVMAYTNPLPFEKFGLLAGRKDVMKDEAEIYTGKGDMSQLDVVKSVGGKTEYNSWLSDECNRITGIEGVLVPPSIIDNKEPIDVLLRDFCRRYQFIYEGESTILNGTIPTYRYVLPDNVFGHPSINNPQNEAYCDMGGCPPHGLLNVTKCAYGTPMFISFPHFYKSDPLLFESVTGLNPNPPVYQSYFDVHPFGFITQGWNVVQINVQVLKSPGITQLTAFDDGQFLPISWMKFGGEASWQPDRVKNIFYDASYVVDGFEAAFKYGSVLTAIVTFVAILIVVRGNYCRSINKRPLHGTESGQMRLI